MKRYGMVIDLKKCLGCQTCTISCKLLHGLGPGIVRVRVMEEEMGRFPDVERFYIPVRCMHCDEPECLKACPTGATKKRPDGIVTVDQDECMGCRYCAVVCPYQARTFLAVEKRYFPENGNIWEAKRCDEHQTGTMEKCDFCYKRIDDGLKKGLEPGKDPEATPMCVISCIGKALYFGDLSDPGSRVSGLIMQRKGFRLKEEVGTEPSIYFLPRR
ncbi:tetrathionate reductase subunit B precursor [bacterium BMS3Bbin06]|nr:tetrathionate reductase subunit B precursor [bacterium BMS3Abin08]GBE34807.1 tetrathionate reductase subunit B precursor [bacterium BMS3Bbin06]HDO35593.1 4Fe-4S dicluster domain-containing protein [Nitrospirota bacterium]HDY70981.1 4Fe-4S dicluster domain-containing protein [Nitrospirota bacterium]